MNIMAKLSAVWRRVWFEHKVEQEIFGKIIPQIKGRAHRRKYAFLTERDLHMRVLESASTLRETLHEFEESSSKMPEAECNALLYIAYRDLNERIRLHAEIARARRECRVGLPESCMVATV